MTYKIEEKVINDMTAECYSRIEELNEYIDKLTEKDADKYAERIGIYELEILKNKAKIAAYNDVKRMAIFG